MKTILYTVAAGLAFRHHTERAELIQSKITQYAIGTISQANNVKRLTGVDALCLCVDDFRVIFTETAETITILEVGPYS